MRFRIKQLPKILIIHLKRFSYNGAKLKNAVNFEEDIQIDAEYLSLNQ
jgi:ubiquitin C-terminal hydrolase